MILSLTLAVALSAPPPVKLDGRWVSPRELPISRVHGYAELAGHAFVAGLDGLYRRRDGAWEKIDERPVRDMVSQSDKLWVLYGDGSVDKLEPGLDRLYYDVMSGASRRPWVSSLGSFPGGVAFGGSGGWATKSVEVKETYPKQLAGDVVTALWGGTDGLWVGTQKHGLFLFGRQGVERFGFAAGLPDSWVTAIKPFEGKPVVALADGGLVSINSGKVSPIAQPENHVRKLGVYGGRIVVGGMTGCWIGRGSNWQKLTDEETSGLVTDGPKLGVCTPSGIAWWK